jgi:D-hexose-6-phosphate mutarotase
MKVCVCLIALPCFHCTDFENTKGVDIDTSGPLKKVLLKTLTGDEAEIYTLGGCVTSFKCNDYDCLFVRPDAKLDGSKPISGGLSQCFPQFGPGAIQQVHARNNSTTVCITSAVQTNI